MSSDTSGVGGEPPARLEVRLLGGVEIILDRRRLRAFNSLRLQRFLALIALRRDLQHRSRLAFELWPDSDERQARTNLRKLLHDFRHSLAVHTLLGWYRDGLDVQARLPLLSTLLGHTKPAHTYWYLSAVPELLALAAERRDRGIGAGIGAGS